MTKEKLPLTNEDLCVQVQEGDRTACEILIQQNEEFLQDCIGKIGIKPEWGLDRDDFMQEGRIALVKTAETFQPTARKKFLTYAGKAIQNALMDLVRSQGRTFEGMAVSAESPYRLTSLDNLLMNESREAKIEIHPNSENPERICLKREGILELRKALNTLDARERDYLIWRYGFDEVNRQRTRKETAKECNLTMGSAKKLEAQALDDAMLELPWWYYEESFFLYKYIPY